MPKLSDTMTEGVVAEWHKKVGDKVAEGELLAEIETDKATMEFESFYTGVLLHIGVNKGQGAPINEVLAIIGQPGEDITALLAGSAVAASDSKTPKKSEASAVNAPAVKTSVTSPQTVQSNGRIFVSPLARKMAEEKGIDLKAVTGSGENNRIVKRDIESFDSSSSKAVSAGVRSQTGPVGTESWTDEPVSQMRKTIANRLAESKFSAPHFYLTIEIDMNGAIEARKYINKDEGIKISYNDMVIKAAAVALKLNPNVNSAWLGDKIRRNDHVHIGVAVAVPDGLLVPVIRHADTKGLAKINEEVRDFAQRAKDKKLQPEDWAGNTFTISNLGMFGIEEFTAIINPPDACILAVGGIREVPVVKDGQVIPGNVMKVTLSCDHRVVDGATGAKFLSTFKSLLENPIRMII